MSWTQRLRFLLASPIVLISLLAWLGVNALLLAMYRQSQDDAFEASVQTLQTLVFALSEHVEGTFEHGDQLLKQDRHTYLADRAALSRQYEAHNVSVNRESFPLEAVARADGIMYLSSSYPRDFDGAALVDLSDRPHIAWQLQSQTDDVFISKAIVGRVSGKPVLNMTRRIATADGKLEGVAVVSVSPDNFISPYRQIVGDTGVVAIYGRDGLSRVRITKNRIDASADISRSPGFARMLAQTHGHYVSVSDVDGQRRLYAFRALQAYPLIVVVGFGIDELQERYSSGRTGTLALGMVLTNLVMLGVVALAIWSQLLRRRVEAANRVLEQKAREALAANMAKSRLIASVSHELRTPLHGIMGHAQLLTFAAPPGSIREDAEGILRSAQHLREVVDELLDMAKAESGAPALHWQPVDLDQLLREVAELHNGSANLKGIEVSLHSELAGSPPFLSDPVALKRILHNLMNNAVKFTSAGSVTLQAQRLPEGVRFVVRDTGVGIDERAMDTLFEPFGSSTHPTDSSTPGTGLGLALSQRLVKALGGQLQVQSQPGAGSVFSFVLPWREHVPPAPEVRS